MITRNINSSDAPQRTSKTSHYSEIRSNNDKVKFFDYLKDPENGDKVINARQSKNFMPYQDERDALGGILDPQVKIGNTE